MSRLRALLVTLAVLATVLFATNASAVIGSIAETRVGNFQKPGGLSLRRPWLLDAEKHQEKSLPLTTNASKRTVVGNSPLDFWDPYGLDGVPYNMSAEERRASLGVVLNPTNQCAATASCEQWPWYQRALIGLMQGFQPAGDAGEGGELSLNPFYGAGTTAFTSVNPFKLAPPGSGKFIMGGLGFGDDAVRAAVNAGSKAGGGLDETAGTALRATADGAATAGGRWARVTESMSERAAAYQARVAGSTGEAFVVGGVKFDGVVGGALLDAKGPGYASFVHNGVFRRWWSGADGLVDQARRQLGAAGNTPIEWHFAEEAAANATRALFQREGIFGITIIVTR